ncbi:MULTISPECIES: hypothetical protein [unclassified Bradyrhizobium]|uniref:hypothetical protein n=1 Tax=unclassified Bradyrhizobium TaxID=2631580 RepID=UPI0028E8201F|nr:MULTISPECIES: hypothetical protein [unclassified Bradyrhizobium]
MSDEAAGALKAQCKEQWERCLYTSNTLMVWLRVLRITRIIFVVVPIIFGALASWEILKGDNRYEYVTATMALIAGIVPAVYAALKLDEHLPTAKRLAGEYKNLEILFGDLAAIGPHKPFDVFEAEYKEARTRQENANNEAYTPPEWCFRRARAKIQSGHYTFGDAPPC